MSDLWDYGSSSSEDEVEAVVSNHNDQCVVGVGTGRDLARYMSSEQKKKYRDILDVDIAPKDLGLKNARRRSVDALVLVEDAEDEDGFEALWRKEREEAIALLKCDSGDDENLCDARGGTAGGRSVPATRTRGRPRKNAANAASPQGRQGEDGAAGRDASRAYIALRACLQDDDVSDPEVASDEDEDLKRIKAMREKRARQELEAEVAFVTEYASPSKRAGDEAGDFGGGGREGDLIELRFVDKQRHEFVTDAVPTSTFDFPCSKFVAHAIEHGWVKSEDDVLRFVFDDEELSRTEHSPQMFDMEDGDTIDVHYCIV